MRDKDGNWLGYEFLEGLSIIIVAIFLVAIVAITDYIKDSKYIELSNNIKEENIPVIRGKLGATQSISVWDVVVGDVVLLETGSSVPADCLIIEA
jgi:Ca2+-transporting ATPase